jgi:hypothetical protein
MFFIFDSDTSCVEFHELATALKIFSHCNFFLANIISHSSKNFVAGLFPHDNGVVVAVYTGPGAGSKHRILLQYFAASFGVNVSAPRSSTRLLRVSSFPCIHGGRSSSTPVMECMTRNEWLRKDVLLGVVLIVV